ncbi:YhgE/Pip domain-containing protein, partial [Deinococcus sp.]|uniref:YhgE/Pip domain-containing protein n=1 Tax=Deinococcus sp. TaxID=47478 RepID=UPI0028698B57
DYRRLSPPERRLWRWPMMWVSAAAITAVPLAYATIYLSSALDPYGHLDTLPVALVNLDQGAVSRGQTYTLGQDVLRNLNASPKFRYLPYPSEEAAQDAVRRGDAYFALTIPATFSKQAIAGSGTDHGRLNFYVAEGSNYFASRVASAFATTLADELNSTLGENRWTVVQRTLADAQKNLTSLRTATSDLQAGASQLKIGTRQLDYGAGTLATGAQKAAQGGQQLVTGAASLSGAVTRLTDGTSKLTSGLKTLEAATPGQATLAPLKSGASRMVSGTGDLAGGLDALSTGAGNVSKGAGTASSSATQLAQGAATLARQLPQLQTGLGELSAGAQRLAASARTASTGATQLSRGAVQLSTTLPTLQSTLAQLSASAAQLARGAASLNGSAQRLAQGGASPSAQSPAGQSATQSSALNGSLGQMSASARQLSISAGSFATRTAALNAGLRTQMLVPQAVREDVATLAAQAETLRAASVTLRARLDQLASPLRQAAAAPVTPPAPPGRTGSQVQATAAQVGSGASTLAAQFGAASRSSDTAVQGARSLGASATTVAGGVGRLASGAALLSTQLNTARAGSTDAANGAKNLAGGAAQLAAGVKSVQSGAGSLAGKAAQAASGARSLQSGAKTLRSGVNSLADGTTKIKTTLGQITRQLPSQSDLNTVKSGARTLAAKSEELGTGLKTVASGATTLQKGASDVNVGAGKLLAGLTTLQDSIPARIDALTGDPAGLSVSVKPDVQTFAAVKNNGAAFAPYFMALSLWVGVTLTTFIFPYQQLPRSGRRSSQLARVLRKAAAPAALVTLQALLVVLSVHLLGVDFMHPAQVAFTAVASSLTFLIMVLALIFCFGAAGRLLALILLVLQLAASGGSYPVETAPHFFQVIHAWLPVTQSVGALRHGLSGAFEGHYGGFMLTLLALFAVSFGLALLGRRRWEFVPDDDFKPLISTPIISNEVLPDPYIDAPSDTPRNIPERAVPN